MKKIIALIVAMLALSACSIQGTWNIKSVTAQGCYSDSDCKPYFTIPGKDGGCDVTIAGTLTFSGESKGTLTEDLTMAVKCPGKQAFTRHFVVKDLKYRIFKSKGKTYIQEYKYNTVQQLSIGENALTRLAKTETNPVAALSFAARGLKPPAYILLRYKYTRKAEEKARESGRSSLRDF